MHLFTILIMPFYTFADVTLTNRSQFFRISEKKNAQKSFQSKKHHHDERYKYRSQVPRRAS